MLISSGNKKNNPALFSLNVNIGITMRRFSTICGYDNSLLDNNLFAFITIRGALLLLLLNIYKFKYNRRIK
jgi:hypothetical protein